MTTETPYADIPEVAPFLLEESYVLGIEAVPGQVTFRVLFVLTPEHPLYRDPRPGEYLCYRRGKLKFGKVERLSWSHPGLKPAIDASGEVDYGQFDLFSRDSVGFVIEGEFGHMEIAAATIEVTIEQDNA